ncbi:serpin B10-like [Lycorma delicatula]|uniref:serpin B10-like n=1 Tax=Lycorma delicatula TaxID=130591 RepID=UPI003F512049
MRIEHENNILICNLKDSPNSYSTDLINSTLEDEELAGTYMKANLLSSQPLPKSFHDILTSYYFTNITENARENSSAHVLELLSDSGVMSHWKDYHKLAVYTYLSHQPATQFQAPHGRSVEVPMIPQVGVLRAGEIPRLNAQAVELLMEANHVSLLLLMPESAEGLDELLVKLPKERLPQLLKSLPLQETEVALPQFAIVTSDLDLAPFFRQLGVRSAFSNDSKKTHVRGVKQNAYFSTSFVAVNSVGSVGSVIEFKSKAAKIKREISNSSIITFDHSFLFFLIHRHSATVLLAGAVQNPTQVPH